MAETTSSEPLDCTDNSSLTPAATDVRKEEKSTNTDANTNFPSMKHGSNEMATTSGNDNRY